MRSRPITTLLLTLALAAGLDARTASAKVTPHPLFSDGAVLQRGKPVPVWGTADDGETVTVTIQGQEAKGVAKEGKWAVNLPALQAGGPFTLTIKGDGDPVVLKDVLVGEVWVCSGQSNMQWPLAKTVGSDEAIAASADPKLRLFTVPRRVMAAEQTDMGTKSFPLKRELDFWKRATPSTVPNFTAVGYYFGRDLRKALGDVPVGLIQSAVGGTPAEAWTRRSAMESEPSLQSVFADDAKAMAAYPTLMERHKAALAKHKTAVAEAKAAGKKPPTAPRAPEGPDSQNRPAVLYNGMIAPLVPYGIAGAIWYQGESNAGRAYQYQTLMSTLIASWRDAFAQGEFPFLFVQLAPYMKVVEKPGPSAWAELRESQLKTSKSVPKTAMAVITDVGEENDIHPQNKAPVGARLALAARAIAYGEKVEFVGPDYAGMTVEGDSVVLKFDHLGGGLEAKGGALKGFAVAGDDHAFVDALAEIKGDTVVVRAPSVPRPTAVRYGWANYPLGNLWGKSGLPASPFRTDDLPLTTKPRTAAAAPPRPRAAAVSNGSR